MRVRRVGIPIAVCAMAAGLGLRAAQAPRAGVDWPSFRGVNGAGVADGHRLPERWDLPAGDGLRWRITVAGLGHSSPVVWGNRICVTTAISGKVDAGLRVGLYGDIASVQDDTVHKWQLVCADKTTGRLLFDETIHEGVPTIKRHTKSTHANTTLATDGTRLIAMLGSEGLHAFDMDGTPLWSKDLGVLDSGYYVVPDAQWEFASSPIIADGKVVIQADVQENSFVAAFDVATGEELWRTPRSDVPTFSTPTVHTVGGRRQILINGWQHTGAYDLETGAEVWKLTGGGDIPVPRPVIGDGLVYMTSSHGRTRPVYAIRETATGDISLAEDESANEHVAWSVSRGGAYLITPVLYDGVLYVCQNNGVFIAFDAATGEQLYQQRLGDGTTGFTASLVAGDGKVYFTSEDGDVFVLKAGREFELLATNPIGEVTLATPAISEGVLYFRTANSLLAVER